MDEQIEGSNGDLRQVGLPESADAQLKEIHANTEWFADEMTIYKIAVAVALSKGWEKGEKKKKSLGRGSDTKFRTLLLDPDENLKHLIEIFVPKCGNQPYRYSQSLAVAGVNYLHEELVKKSRSIVDVLALEEDSK